MGGYQERTIKDATVAKNAIVEKEKASNSVRAKNALAFFQSMLDDNLRKAIKKRSGSPRLTDDTIQGPCVLASFRSSVVFFSRKKNFFYRIDDAHVARFSQSIIDLLYNAMEYQPIIAN